MRRLCFVWITFALASVAVADTAQPVSAEPTSDISTQVQGTCRTPREAMLQLLYWIQDAEDRVDPARAAACFDTSTISRSTAATRAEQLKRTLDARGLYIDIDAIPASPDYQGTDGIRRWRLADLPSVEIVKLGETWKFSTGTIKAIPGLYEETMPQTLERLLAHLPSWFHARFLGMAVWQLCGILLFILLSLALQKIVVFVIGTYVRKTAGRLAGWIDKAIERIARPIGGLVMAGILSIVIPWLQLSVRVSQVARAATVALAAYSVGWLAYRLVDVLTDWLEFKASGTSSKLDDQLVPLLRKTLKVFIVVISVIFLLQNLDVDVGSLLAGLGLGGLAFALAAKDTVANFFGSLVVFIDKPFQIGDWVMIDGTEGTIEEVGFRTTRVRTFYNSLVTIPNAKLTDTAIDNYGARRWRRYVANLGLTYDTPPERIEAFCEGIRGIIQRLDNMRRDYAIVEFNQYGESGLNVMVYCFMDAPDWGIELRVRTALNLEILRLADALGVSFAFPTRTLHLETQSLPAQLPGRRSLDPTQIADVVRRFSPPGAADERS
ncbi:MAG: mechanosensitive ion channel family protein [Kofleriaceae bacterium]